MTRKQRASSRNSAQSTMVVQTYMASLAAVSASMQHHAKHLGQERGTLNEELRSRGLGPDTLAPAFDKIAGCFEQLEAALRELNDELVNLPRK
jgi:hypothetical protein